MNRTGVALAAAAVVALAACGPGAGGDGRRDEPATPSTVPRPTGAGGIGGSDVLFYVDRAGIERWEPGRGVARLVEDTRDAGELAPAPGGSRVAYVRSTGAAGGFVDELWVAEVDGRDRPRRLVDPDAVAAALGAGEDTPPGVRRPDWSPDGTRVAFLAVTGAGPVLVVADAGTGTVDAAVAPRRAAMFAWSPDGSSLAYASEEGGAADVAVVDPAAGTTTLWARALRATSLAWGRGGESLVTAVGDPGTGDVAVLDSAGAAPRSLLATPAPAPCGDVAVLSDGAVVYALGETSPTRPRLLQKLPSAAGAATAVTIADDVGGPRGGPRWSRGDLVAMGLAGGGGVLAVGGADGRSRVTVATDVSTYAWAPPPPPGGGEGRLGL